MMSGQTVFTHSTFAALTTALHACCVLIHRLFPHQPRRCCGSVSSMQFKAGSSSFLLALRDLKGPEGAHTFARANGSSRLAVRFDCCWLEISGDSGVGVVHRRVSPSCTP